MTKYTPLHTSTSSKSIQFAIFGTVCVAFMAFLSQFNETAKCKETFMLAKTSLSDSVTLAEFNALNARIVQEKVKLCDCGCLYSPIKNCPRRYSLKDIEKSAYAIVTKEISESMESELMISKTHAQIACVRDGVRSGGICLDALLKESQRDGKVLGTITIPFPARDIAVMKGQLMPSERMLGSLDEFMDSEQVKSISDFGAGVGQYGYSLVRRQFASQGQFLYRGYDGAGDVELYTQGLVKYFDLGVPLHLPVADWVMFFETAHLIPNHKEGMVIRNLHAHNCRGIILSWGTHSEIEMKSSNLHDEEYLVQIFTQLGYYNDQMETNHFRESINLELDGKWMENLLVLRRYEPIC